MTLHNAPSTLRPPRRPADRGGGTLPRRLSIPLVDVETAAGDLTACLPRVCAALDAAVDGGGDGGGNVLIHCGAGVSRSAAAAAAWLIWRGRSGAPGRPYSDDDRRRGAAGAPSAAAALATLADLRPTIDVNPGFRRALHRWQGAAGAADPSPLSALGLAAAEAEAGTGPAPGASAEDAAAVATRPRDPPLAAAARPAVGRGASPRPPSPPGVRARRERSRSRSPPRAGPAAAPPPSRLTDPLDGDDPVVAVVRYRVERAADAGGRAAVLSWGEARLRPGRPFVLGRDEAACDLPMLHASVSRMHCRLAADAGGGVTLSDLGSAHGTEWAPADGAAGGAASWLERGGSRRVGAGGGVLRLGASTRRVVLEAVTRRGWG